MGGDTADERAVLRRMIDGYQVSRAIGVVAELGIADLLAEGPKSVGELARATGADPRSLHRLLRALAAVRVFAKVEGEAGKFRLTGIGEALRSDVAGSYRASAMQAGQASMWAAWGDLGHSVMTGQSAFRHVHGMSAWEYRDRDLAAGELFDHAMADSAREITAAIVGAYDFAGAELVVDVGGGRGLLLAAILAAHPHLRGILFDRPRVVAAAEEVLRAAGVLDRCRAEAGDFRDGVPAGGDVYILKGVIHDWDDGDARRILRECRRAMGERSRLLLIEQVIPQDRAPEPFTLFMDLHMLAIHGAAERTEQEFAALLDTAGVRLERIVPVLGAMHLLEAVPV